MSESFPNEDNVNFLPKGKVEKISALQEMDFPGEWYELASEEHFWFKWRLAAVKAQLKSLSINTSQSACVFDIGCGNGVLTTQLERISSWVVDGADLNLKALTCHPRSRGKILYYDILECRQEFREFYDYVMLFDVLEHISETRAFLEAAIMHLKQDGIMFVGVPALQCLFSNYDNAAGHYRRYSKSSLRAEVAGLGVDVLDVAYWGMGQVPILMLRKLMLRIWNEDQNIIRKGFQPPGSWFNNLMFGLMKLETSICKSPILGSSLVMAVRKR